MIKRRISTWVGKKIQEKKKKPQNRTFEQEQLDNRHFNPSFSLSNSWYIFFPTKKLNQGTKTSILSKGLEFYLHAAAERENLRTELEDEILTVKCSHRTAPSFPAFEMPRSAALTITDLELTIQTL